MKEFRVTTELNREKWGEFVYQHPDGNIFQTPEMFEVYKETKHWEPLFFAIIDNNENILSLLLTAIQKEIGSFLGRFTARAVVWGGPLLSPIENKGELINLTLKTLDELLGKKVIYVQFRNLKEFSQEKLYFVNNNYSYQDHLNYHINLLSSEEELLDRMSKNRRKNIKKAMNNDLKVAEINDINDLKTFYNLLRKTYSRIKLPCPSLEFFKNAFRYLEKKGFLKIFLISKDKKNIASRAVLVYKNNIYDWYAGSSNNTLALYANDLLIWEILLWGKRRGCNLFDFGGAGSPGNFYGPGEYKRRFGGKEVNFGRFEKTYIKSLHWFIEKYSTFLKNPHENSD
jgi:lipid II:glycine glycyltransferase (peptidoglycan interpeptide bridge formation enzyme)